MRLISRREREENVILKITRLRLDGSRFAGDLVVCENSARGLRGCAVVEPEHPAQPLAAPYVT